MKKLMASSLTTLTLITSFAAFVTPALALNATEACRASAEEKGYHVSRFVGKPRPVLGGAELAMRLAHSHSKANKNALPAVFTTLTRAELVSVCSDF